MEMEGGTGTYTLTEKTFGGLNNRRKPESNSRKRPELPAPRSNDTVPLGVRSRRGSAEFGGAAGSQAEVEREHQTLRANPTGNYGLRTEAKGERLSYGGILNQMV